VTTPRAALASLLRGTSLSFTSSSDGTVTIVNAAAAPAQRAALRPVALESPPPPAQSAPAAEPPAASLGEIIVTARRREENLMKVPVAVSVMSSNSIANAGIKDMKDLATFTPGLFAATGASNGRNERSQVRLIFRGLSTSSGAVFIDGAPYGGNGSPDVTDVERIEVLKGPQSVYFGRATFAGAVNYVTKRPANSFQGHISEDAYTYGGSDGRLSVEGPLVKDLLTMRLSGRYYVFGGQYRDGLDPAEKLGNRSTKSFSVALASSPTKNLNLSGYYSYSLDEDGPAEVASLKVIGPGPFLNCNLGGTGGAYYCGALPRLSDIPLANIGAYTKMDPYTYRELAQNIRGYPVPFDSAWLAHFGLKRRVHHAHFKADFSTDSGWGAAFLAGYSQTKYASYNATEGRDTANLPNPFYPATPALLAAACAAPSTSPANAACFAPQHLQLTTHSENLTNDYNAELRLSSPQDKRIRATAGASYYALGGPASANLGVQNSGRLINGGGGGLLLAVNTPAVFGGVYFDATDKLKLSVEGRYQWDGIRQQQTFPTVSPKLHQVFTSFSPRLTADYSLTPHSLLYGTISRGYRPGGFNPGLIGLTPAVLAQLTGQGTNLTYEQERLDNFEIGHKGAWLDNRLRTTLALYYMKYRNGQVSNPNFFTNSNGTTASVTVISNVGQVNLKGVELEADFAATRELTLSGSLGYADNKIVSYVYSPNGTRINNSTVVTGNQLDQQPKLTISLSPTYKRQIAPGWEGFVRLDYSYRSKIFLDPTNVAWRDGRSLVNLRTGVTRDKLRFELYVNNLFDNDVLSDGSKSSDSYLGPSGACPPCYTAAAPPVTSSGVSVLNAIFLGLPVKRTFGAHLTYDF
jgi:iron complex outermembrane receptor protein